MNEFKRIVGDQWVYTSEEDLRLYRDAYSPYLGEAEERIASAAVAPDGVEQVQAIVRAANRFKIPLYPISTGKNLGYGGSAPAYSGSVVLDLKRMNRVLEVNEKQAFCLVEPGVSYFDLYRHLEEHKIKLWMDIPDPGWGSLVGNALDRGGGYTAARFRNHFEAHCGMEVVLPNGELMRTGMGALPGSETWQQYKSGFGPVVDGIFSQSNFGIVTKMGFWMMPEPEAYLKCTVTVPGFRDIVPFVDTINHLENSRVFDGLPDFMSPLLGVPSISEAEKIWEEGPPMPPPKLMELLQSGATPDQLEQYGRQNGLHYWGCHLTFYGPEEVVRAQWKYAQQQFLKAIPDAQCKEHSFHKLPLSEEEKSKVHMTQFGIPSLRLFSIGARTSWNPTPSHGHMWFSPVIPRTGEAVLRANEVFAKASRELGVQMLTPITLPAAVWERAFVFIVGFPVTENKEVNKKNRAAFREMIKIAAKEGWGEYRTAPAYQDDVMATYSFGDHALLRFHETVKDAIDPNGIISPGRYGIWPKHLRGKRK
ncbi:FAD-binding oxidoreductase [Pseudomonas sp. UL073]|uniref:FAD-binding oxidoreductase n=1 Tax=Zestomonas insulae TaxID=2809017 RepID=A0ABS2ID50_9GAMM|nr:FAD-binding oxidoreductase [Pseudomonas insulae]